MSLKQTGATLNKLFVATLVLLPSVVAQGQMRIVTYNTLNATPRPELVTVLEAIGEEVVNGIAKPIDILLLQEQDEPFTTTQLIVNSLNNVYGAGTYARGTLATGPSFSSLRQSVVYHTGTVQLLEERSIARTTIGVSTPPREAQRTKFRPVGYDSSADFYIYNSHFKAGSSSSDIARRGAEAINLRNDADALGEDTPIIFAGDFNLRNDGSSNFLSNPAEPAFQTLITAGNAQAFDPVASIAPAQWKNNFSARFVHTHGGSEIDDRFDFQLPSTEWSDGEGLDYIEGSYRAFGNNGSTYNDPIDFGNSIVFDFGPDPTYTTQQVLSALNDASDHLPVVADYQLPSLLSGRDQRPGEHRYPWRRFVIHHQRGERRRCRVFARRRRPRLPDRHNRRHSALAGRQRPGRRRPDRFCCAARHILGRPEVDQRVDQL